MQNVIIRNVLFNLCEKLIVNRHETVIVVVG